MSLFWKGLVVLLLALPVGAYVTGSLAGSAADLPDRRAPVVVGDPAPVEPTRDAPRGAGRPGDGPAREPGDRRGRGAGGADDEVQVIRPQPQDVGDDDDDDDADDADDGAGNDADETDDADDD